MLGKSPSCSHFDRADILKGPSPFFAFVLRTTTYDIPSHGQSYLNTINNPYTRQNPFSSSWQRVVALSLLFLYFKRPAAKIVQRYHFYIMSRRRSRLTLITISRVCLVVGACAVCLWSNVSLSGSVLRSPTGIIANNNFDESSNQIILVKLSDTAAKNTRRVASGAAINVTSMSSPPVVKNTRSLSSKTSSKTETTAPALFSTLPRGTATVSELDSDILDQVFNETDHNKLNNNTTTSTILTPKQIFMYWDQGWDVAPPLQQLARQIAQRLNPLYELYALDQHLIEQLVGTNRRWLLDDATFAKLSIQAKSDVYRTLLLYQYGGIWIDATVFVNKPLDDWLNGYMNRSHSDLWGFQRTRPLKMRRPIIPFLGSWFLAAPPQSRTVANILRVIKKEPQRLTQEYFWWHRIVSELAIQHQQPQDDTLISNDKNETTSAATTTMMLRRSLFSDKILPSMNPCLQRDSNWKHSAPVIKKRSSNQFAMAFSVWKDCCGGGNDKGGGEDITTGVGSIGNDSNNIASLCAKFRCDVLAVNFELAHEIEAAYNRTLNSWQPSFETPQYRLEQEAKRASP
jgi:Capsular polysaccharide synthesis protein